MMEVGFTGSRDGMTARQRSRVCSALLVTQTFHRHITVHHGDCIGADAEFHKIARELGIPVVLHPPTDPSRRAWCQGAIAERPPKPYLQRNQEIVRETALLLATPKEDREPRPGRRQGTWSTVRYARRVGRPHTIIWPKEKRVATIADIVGDSGPTAELFGAWLRDPTTLEEQDTDVLEAAHRIVWELDPIDRMPLAMWDALPNPTDRARVTEFAYALGDTLLERDPSA